MKTCLYEWGFSFSLKESTEMLVFLGSAGKFFQPGEAACEIYLFPYAVVLTWNPTRSKVLPMCVTTVIESQIKSLSLYDQPF